MTPGSQSQITITLPLVNAGIENSDAERRRQKALKALKERLKKPDEEDVANQWVDRNTTESVPLIESDQVDNSTKKSTDKDISQDSAHSTN